MQDVTRKRSMHLGLLIALALAAVALVLPPLCGDAFGKDGPETAEETKEVKDKDPVKPDEEKLDDFRIDLKGKEGEDLEQAIETAMRDISERMEALEKRMDEMMRRRPSPHCYQRPECFIPWPRQRFQFQDRDELRRQDRELLEQFVKEGWKLDMGRCFEEGGGDEPFRFNLKVGPKQMRFTLRMDMEETDDAYVLKLDMPGMDKEDIVVELTDNVLTISGERKERLEEDQEEGEPVRREITYGSFKRTMTLPSDADSEKITSEYDDGVLVITVPKKEGQADESRRIIVD